jgi:hypothetical protein
MASGGQASRRKISNNAISMSLDKQQAGRKVCLYDIENDRILMDLPLFNVNLFGLKLHVRLRIAQNPPYPHSLMARPYDMVLMVLLRKLVWTNIAAGCASNRSNPHDKLN